MAEEDKFQPEVGMGLQCTSPEINEVKPTTVGSSRIGTLVIVAFNVCSRVVGIVAVAL